MDKTEYYRVLDPKGLLVSGTRFPLGTLVPEAAFSPAHVKAFTRFKQIDPVSLPQPEPATPEAPKPAASKTDGSGNEGGGKKDGKKEGDKASKEDAKKD